MQELITGFVGLDAHAESTAIAVAEVGRTAPEPPLPPAQGPRAAAQQDLRRARPRTRRLRLGYRPARYTERLTLHPRPAEGSRP